MTTFVSINGNTIRSNAIALNRDSYAPQKHPIRLAKSPNDRSPEYASEVAILDAEGNEVARLVYNPMQAIMNCGARLVLKAEHGVKVLG